MKTFEGKQLRLIRDRTIVIVQSNTNRQIVTKLAIASANEIASARVFILEPFQYLLCTGRTLRQAGLVKEMDRSAIVVDQLVDGVKLSDLIKKHLSRDLLVQVDKDFAESLRAVSAAATETAEKDKQQTEQQLAEQNAERNAQVNAELQQRVAEHEKFEKEEATGTGAAPASLEEAVAVQAATNPPVNNAPVIDEPVTTTEPGAAEEVAAPKAEDVPAPELKLVPAAIPEAENKTQDKKKNRPKKRD